MIIDLICALSSHHSKILDVAKSREIFLYFLSEKGLKSSYLHRNIKDAILNMFNVVSEFKRQFFTKNKDLTEALLIHMVGIMVQTENLNFDDDNDVNLGLSCVRLAEVLASNLPKKLLTPIFEKIFGELWASKDSRQLITMYILYTAIASGLQDVLKPQLPTLMKEIIPFGINHSELKVKNFALRAVSFFSEFLLPDILEYSNIVIPALLNAMESNDLDLAEHTIFVLDVFTEYLEEDQVKDYLPVLIPKVLEMIVHPKATYRIRRFSVDALSSLMNAGKGIFGPFLDDTYKVLRELAFSKNEEVLLIRGTVFQCIGNLLTLVCQKDKSHFSSKFLDIHTAILQCLRDEPNNYDLVEGCFTFLYSAVNVLGEEYGKEVTPQVYPLAKVILEKSNIVRKDSKDDDGALDDNDNGPSDFYLVNLDEAKSAILHWVSETASHSPFTFLQFEEEVITILDGCMTYTEGESELVRQQSISAMKGILIGKIKRSHNGILPPFRRSWETPRLHVDALTYFSTQFFIKIAYYIETESNKENVVLAIEALKELLKETGPDVLRDDEENFIKLIEGIADFDIACFKKGDEEDEEDLESDGKIFMVTVDLLVVISEILKADAFKILSETLSGMLVLVEKGETFELDEFLGGFCDIIENCPALIGKDTDLVLDLIYESPVLEDAAPVRNACFLLGRMHELNPQVMDSYVLKSLEFYMKVHTTFTEAVVKDNVVAGIVRIYAVDTQSRVPTDKVVSAHPARRHSPAGLPVPRGRNRKPDHRPVRRVASQERYSTSQSDPQIFAGHMDQIIKMLLDLIVKAEHFKFEDDDKLKMKNLIHTLSSDPQSKAALEANSATMDQAAISKFLA